MILILSDPDDLTCISVIDWLAYWQVDYVRLNSDDFLQQVRFFSTAHESIFETPDRSFSVSDVKAVWNWWRTIPVFLRNDISSISLASRSIDDYLRREYTEFLKILGQLFVDVFWLGPTPGYRINKIESLNIARRNGFLVPETILTNSRSQIENWQRQYGRIVIKSIRDMSVFELDSGRYAPYTSEIYSSECESSAPLFPVLIQRMIEKHVEIRTFYLCGKCYSMAIFSQFDQSTQVDYRLYNYDNANRMIPINLPQNVESSIIRFMEDSKLNTGSIDLILTPEGEYVFLEVNPIGQFGNLSRICNYHLEKLVAKTLIDGSKS